MKLNKRGMKVSWMTWRAHVLPVPTCNALVSNQEDGAVSLGMHAAP